MWTSNRVHIFRIDGIQCHNIGVFSNVVVQKTRNVSRKNLSLAKQLLLRI